MSYRNEVLRNLNIPPLSLTQEQTEILLGVVGLSGEAGEALEVVKKHIFHGKPLDREKLILELGDICWYLEESFNALGVTREEVEQKNTDKLRKRYPDGFKQEKAE